MQNKQLGIIGNDYELTTKIFEDIINKTNASCDQENIIINLIYCKFNDLEVLRKKCEYLKSIGSNKILITSNISNEDICYLNRNLDIDILTLDVDIQELVNYFKNEVLIYE